jgi:hypothetical protein
LGNGARNVAGRLRHGEARQTLMCPHRRGQIRVLTCASQDPNPAASKIDPNRRWRPKRVQVNLAAAELADGRTLAP